MKKATKLSLTKEEIKRRQDMLIIKKLGKEPTDMALGETLEQYMKRKIKQRLLFNRKLSARINGYKYPVMPTQEENEALKKEVDRIFHEELYGKSNLANRLNFMKKIQELIDKTNKKPIAQPRTPNKTNANLSDAPHGFHARFQKIDDTTIQETDDFGHVRQFHLNKKTGAWEVEGIYPQKAELTLVGKNEFCVKESDPGVYETILYTPSTKVRETFVCGKNGKYFLTERTKQNLNGRRDRQMFDEHGKMIEQRISNKGALVKMVLGGKVLFDSTKHSARDLKNTVNLK